MLKYFPTIAALAVLICALDWWLKAIYKVSLHEVVTTLHKTDVRWVIRGFTGVGFTLSFMFCWFVLEGIINIPLLELAGKKTELVYAGNPAAGISQYYALPLHSVEHGQTHPVALEKINLSFDPIFKAITFTGVQPGLGFYGSPYGALMFLPFYHHYRH